MNYTESNKVCEPVDIVDKKGVHKFLYLCKKPFSNRLAAYKHNKVHLWTDIALTATVVILGATLISLLAFNLFKQKNQIRITLAPKHVVLGEVATFDVTYENTSKKKPTHETNITLRAPQTFQNPTLISPALEQVSLTLPLGTLDPQESGSFEVSGELFANINTDISLLFVTDYINEVSEPQQESTLTTFGIKNSIVSMNANIPSTAIIGSDITFDINFETLPISLRDYTLTITHPQGFALNKNSESLDTLTPENKTLSISGVINGSPSNSPLVISLTRKVNDAQLIYAQISKPIATHYSKIKIDATTRNAHIAPGEIATTHISVANNESVTLTNAQLELYIEGEFVDISYLEKTYSATRNHIIIPLPDIAPGQSHEQDVSVSALSYFIPKTENLGPQDLTVRAKIVGKLHGSDIAVNTATPLIIPVSSAPLLGTQGVFYTNTGDQIGVGSIPPTVDEYTAYWTLVRVKNGVNPLSNVTVRAQLAPSTDYADVYNITAGSPIRLLPDTNQIEWFVGDVGSYAGVTSSAPEMRLQIGVTPTQQQRGQSIPLLTNITLTGTDTRTGAAVTASGANITTAIFKDKLMNVVR